MHPVAVVYIVLLVVGSFVYGIPDPVATLVIDTDIGFWAGLFHGVISPISLIVSVFNDTATIYSSNNSGFLYNFGFLVGTALAFSSKKTTVMEQDSAS